jgi:hypothetical protein
VQEELLAKGCKKSPDHKNGLSLIKKCEHNPKKKIFNVENPDYIRIFFLI